VTLASARLFGTYFRPQASPSRVRRPINQGGDSQIVDLHARCPTNRELGLPAPGDLPTRDEEEEKIRAAEQGQSGEVARDDTGDAELRFRVPATGTFLSITVVSALTALILQAASGRLRELDDTTAASVLLALPVLTLGFLTQAGEHAVATRLLGGVRLAGAIVGLCALLVAGVIAGGYVSQRPAAAPSYSCTSRAPASAPARGVTPLRRNQQGARRPVNPTTVGARVRCTPSEPGTARTVVAPPAQSVADLAAWAATVAAFVLLAGWLRTSVATGRRRASEPKVGS
jgi:hypothetical protein